MPTVAELKSDLDYLVTGPGGSYGNWKQTAVEYAVQSKIAELRNAGVSDAEIRAQLGSYANYLLGPVTASAAAPATAPVTASVSPTGEILVSHDPIAAGAAVTFPPWLIWGGLGLAAYLLLK